MTHGNMGINGTAYRIIATRELLGFLSSKDDKKYSRMDAFIDLLDRTADGTQHTLRHDRTSEQLLKQQAVITITKLAEAWGWHRETVRNFLLALEKMNVIRLHQEAKFSIITFNLFSIGNDDQYSHPLTDDEERLNRWISGYIAIEEMAGEFVQSVTEMETMLAELPTDKTHSTGIRLHKMVSHLILQNSNLIPCDSKVETALSVRPVQPALQSGSDTPLANVHGGWTQARIEYGSAAHGTYGGNLISGNPQVSRNNRGVLSPFPHEKPGAVHKRTVSGQSLR